MKLLYTTTPLFNAAILFEVIAIDLPKVYRSGILAAFGGNVKSLNDCIRKALCTEKSYVYLDRVVKGFIPEIGLEFTSRYIEKDVHELMIVSDKLVGANMIDILMRFNLNGLKTFIEINNIKLKVGEWLAALLYEHCGDKAGFAATIDEALDRQ